ncbi:MAG: DUF4860 domain-containing protein [Clostridia bacterium]
MEKRNRNTQIESILVIFLIICFCVAAAALIRSGQQSFRRIVDNKNQTENLRIAFSYVNMRIRQNDIGGNVVFRENAVESEDALTIYHAGLEEGLVTHIFHKDGVLWEWYGYRDDVPTKDYSFKIIELDNLALGYDGNLHGVTLSTLSKKGILTRHFIAIRTREASYAQ